MTTIYTAVLITTDLCNGDLQEFIQHTFAKRGIIITYFHDIMYQKMIDCRIATIKFNFYIESTNNINQKNYMDRMMYRLNKFANEVSSNPIIEPFEIIHTRNPRECWVIKLIRPTIY